MIHIQSDEDFHDQTAGHPAAKDAGEKGMDLHKVPKRGIEAPAPSEAEDRLRNLTQFVPDLLDNLRSRLQSLADAPRTLIDTLRSSKVSWIITGVLAVGLAAYVGFLLGTPTDDRETIPVEAFSLIPMDRIPDELGTLPGEVAESYAWPVQDVGRVTSCFGPHRVFGTFRNHRGLDIAVNEGTPILASRSGVAVYFQVSSGAQGYGTYVMLRHADGKYTLYAHLQPRLSLQPGEAVTQGTILGFSGNTGFSTGPHLHFEVIGEDAKPQNPARFLSSRLDNPVFHRRDNRCWVNEMISQN